MGITALLNLNFFVNSSTALKVAFFRFTSTASWKDNPLPADRDKEYGEVPKKACLTAPDRSTSESATEVLKLVFELTLATPQAV